MNWENKKKTAYAIIISDPVDYGFLPVYKILGVHAIESFFLLNLKWQKEIFDSIKNTKDTDLYIYAKNNIHYSNLSLKKFLKHEFPDLEFSMQNTNPVEYLNTKYFLKNKTSNIIQTTDSTMAAEMNSVFRKLSGKYKKVTVWNLESPVLNSKHILIQQNPGLLFKITTPNGRLILLSCEADAFKSDHQIDAIHLEIPGIYDLESIQDIICHLSLENQDISKKRAKEIGAAISAIQGNFP